MSYLPNLSNLVKSLNNALTISLTLLFIASSTSHAQTSTAQFNAGDNIVFIGDSITHGGSYHKNIFLFNATRYPTKKIKYYNAGISGDTADGTLKRFNDDIAIHQPTVATIMLGMNDATSGIYQKPVTNALAKQKQQKLQASIRQRYLTNMEELVHKLSAIHSKVILIKPSIYDDTAKLKAPSLFGKNAELQNYGHQLSAIAAKYNANIIDFYTPLMRVNKQLQAHTPSATIISQDRVHPGDKGHFVMSYAFLKAQNNARYVANFEFNAKQQTVTKFDHCKLAGKVNFTKTAISFNCQSQALPFPVEGEQLEAAKLVPFQQELNQQLFTVNQLATGRYRLLIDNKKVAEYSAEDLAKGVNLATNKNTPMYQQALAVKALNDKRAAESDKIRTIMHVRYRMLSNYPNIDKNNLVEVKEALNQHVEKAQGKPWYGYLKQQASKYFEIANEEANARANIEALFAEIYRVNQPKSHHWQLIKLPTQ